jgi:hypothetical protein
MRIRFGRDRGLSGPTRLLQVQVNEAVAQALLEMGVQITVTPNACPHCGGPLLYPEPPPELEAPTMGVPRRRG